MYSVFITLTSMKQWVYDFLNTLFPINCQVCGSLLHASERVLCLRCEYKLPRNMHVDNPENPVSKLFWGRTRIISATALFKFEKGSAYQVLLHNLKYRGLKHNGLYLGQLLGHALVDTVFSQCDYIVPVPLHPSRQRKRGYNQAELIARSVSEILKIPVRTDILKRRRKTDSQTRKNRFDRYLNMKSMIELSPEAARDPDLLDHSRPVLLLIDDVVTTGSTLEACSEAILTGMDALIYAATVAYA